VEISWILPVSSKTSLPRPPILPMLFYMPDRD
jgi:hypothetical protein